MLYATVRQRKIYVKNPTSVVRNGVGVDQLTFDMDDEWKEMTSIVCVFTLKHKVAVEEEVDGETVTEYEEKEVTKEMIHRFGEPVLVPWECLAETGLLSVSCTGYVGEEKVMTTMMPDSFWTVVQNGPVTGDTPMEPTPTLYEQVLAAAGAANTAASEANAARARLLADKENGVFNGVSPTVEIGNVTTGLAGAEAKVENVGTPLAVKLNFVLPRGVQGPKGEPGIQGAPGERGADGAPGKDGRGVESMDYDAAAREWTIRYTDGSGMVIYTPQENGAVVGSDGGYYSPSVSVDGVLSWKPSKISMPTVPSSYIKGDPGAAGRGVSAISYSAGTKEWTVEYTDGSSQTLPSPSIPSLLSDLTGDSDHRTVSDAEKAAWNGKSEFSGAYGDLSGVPSSFTPANHNQAASTITAGTFGGQMKASSSGQTAGTYLLRNSRLAASAVNPTVNGEICWVYQ